jgi:hypothetical protein
MAPPAPRECNQPAQRIASQTIRASHPVHRSALHRILCSAAHRANATSPRSVLHRKQSAHRIPCIAAHYIASCAAQRTARMQPARAKARGFIKTLFLAHCIANNPRTENQPVTHRPPRPLCIARRTAHTSHLQLCTRFAVLCAGFVWFVVLTFPKFNLYTFLIRIFV